MTEEQQKDKKPTKPIGSIGEFSTFGKKRSEVQKSTSPKIQTSRSSDVQIPTHLDSRKSKHPDWKQKTVYLPADLAKWLNVHAAQTELEVSEIVAMALRDYREKYK